MSQVSAPFGLRLVQSPSGILRVQQNLYNAIPSGYASNIFVNQPVAFNTSGQLVPVTLTTDEYVGTFESCVYFPPSRPGYGYWPANQLSNFPVQASVGYDPNYIYEIQTDGTVTQAVIGATSNFTNVTSGSTLTGLSSATLNATVNAPGATGQFRIIDLAPYPNNNWGDPFVIVRGQVGLHQFTANKAGI